jgi:hypothetical protein
MHYPAVLWLLALGGAAAATSCGGKVGTNARALSASPDGGASDAGDDASYDATGDAGPTEVIPNPPPTPFPSDAADAPPVVCSPGEVSNFIPEWRPPPQGLAGACTPGNIEMAAKACFGSGASLEACNAWQKASGAGACFACLMSPAASYLWSPIINMVDVELFNLAACVALADPAGVDCAQAVQAAFQCEMESCLTLCPIPGSGGPSATQDALGACFAAAGSSWCAPYASAAAACEADAGAAAFCYTAPADDAALVQLLGVACGQPDGG